MTNTSLPDEISTEDLADLIGVDGRTVRNLVSRGIITKAGRGRHPFKASIQALIADAKRQATSKVEAEARARLLTVKADEIAVRTAARRNELVHVEDFDAGVMNVIGFMRQALDGIASRITRDLPLRRKIEHEVDDAMNQTAMRCAAVDASLRAGKDPAETVHERPDRQPEGGKLQAPQLTSGED